MKAREIAKSFFEYIRTVDMGPLDENDTNAVLYGTDEIFVDVARKTLTLPTVGSIDATELLLGRAELPHWYGIIRMDSELSIVGGYGNPYDASMVNELPTKNGYIVATPATLIKAEFKDLHQTKGITGKKLAKQAKAMRRMYREHDTELA